MSSYNDRCYYDEIDAGDCDDADTDNETHGRKSTSNWKSSCFKVALILGLCVVIMFAVIGVFNHVIFPYRHHYQERKSLWYQHYNYLMDKAGPCRDDPDAKAGRLLYPSLDHCEESEVVVASDIAYDAYEDLLHDLDLCGGGRCDVNINMFTAVAIVVCGGVTIGSCVIVGLLIWIALNLFQRQEQRYYLPTTRRMHPVARAARNKQKEECTPTNGNRTAFTSKEKD